MARHKPNIILEVLDGETDMSHQVIGVEYLYIVMYKGKPINLRSVNTLSDYPGPQYRRSVYTQEGYANNLAKKLNKKFNCADFSVSRFPE